jgi:hypothetical protein
MLLVDFMLVASGGVLIFRKDFIAIYQTPPEATSIKSTRSIVELILENTVSRKE